MGGARVSEAGPGTHAAQEVADVGAEVRARGGHVAEPVCGGHCVDQHAQRCGTRREVSTGGRRQVRCIDCGDDGRGGGRRLGQRQAAGGRGIPGTGSPSSRRE